MENIKNRWNAFSTAGKAIIIIVILGIIGGIYYAHSVRINPVGKSYTMDISQKDRSYTKTYDFEFTKDGHAEMKYSSEDGGGVMGRGTYTYTQKQILMTLTQEGTSNDATLKLLDLKKSSHGIISGKLYSDGINLGKFVMQPK